MTNLLREENTKIGICILHFLLVEAPLLVLLCSFFADVVVLGRAVDLICDGYFDGHDVLFH
jgi:hypothetical protein